MFNNWNHTIEIIKTRISNIIRLYGKESISKIGNLRKNIRENKNNKENVIAEI